MAQTKERYEDQREAQVAIKAAFLSSFVQKYALLDFNRIDETAVPWVQTVMDDVQSYRQLSADQAGEDFAQFRRLHIPGNKAAIPAPQIVYTNSRGFEAPTERETAIKRPKSALDRQKELRRQVQEGRFTLSLANVDWADFDRAAERALLVTGPGELKRQSKLGRSEAEARVNGLVKAAGAASKHVLIGARETTMTLTEIDEAAIGWVRVTDRQPCAFCALLSSKGPHYKTKESAAFQPHDGCGCIPVAVYSKSAPWPGRAREFRQMYNANIQGKFSGGELLNAWRRHYEQQLTGRKPRKFRDRVSPSAA